MSPRQNRVTPTGEIVAIPLRGGWMGNRGILHDDAGRVVRHHASSLWITCALSFKGWRAAQWQPHHYTVLFFHDEAVSLSAGHRPCALCRREAYDAYQNALAEHDRAKPLSAKEIDARLHAERLIARTRTRRLHDDALVGGPQRRVRHRGRRAVSRQRRGAGPLDHDGVCGYARTAATGDSGGAHAIRQRRGAEGRICPAGRRPSVASSNANSGGCSAVGSRPRRPALQSDPHPHGSGRAPTRPGSGCGQGRVRVDPTCAEPVPGAR